MTVINVSNIRDPHSIVAAFQEAIDAVVTPANIKQLLVRGRVTDQRYQHIHWHDRESALGNVSMMTSSSRNSITLFMNVYYGYYEPGVSRQAALSAELLPQVASRLLPRLAVNLHAEDLVLTVPLRYERVNDEYKLMITAPAVSWRALKSVKVVLCDAVPASVNS